MKSITELQSIKIPNVRMIGNYISPIQDTVFGLTIDLSTIISITEICDDYSMDEYIHRVYFIINFNSSINGSIQRLIIEYKCRELYTYITREEFDTSKYTQTYSYNGTYYKWEFDIIGAKEILQQFVNDLINLWEKYKLQSITH